MNSSACSSKSQVYKKVKVDIENIALSLSKNMETCKPDKKKYWVEKNMIASIISNFL